MATTSPARPLAQTQRSPTEVFESVGGGRSSSFAPLNSSSSSTLRSSRSPFRRFRATSAFPRATSSGCSIAYVVVLAGLLLLGGKLADIFGQRRIFLTGFAVLTASSLGAGLAPSGEALFAARGAMGLGAALIAPSALSLLFGIFGPRPQELGKALAFFGAVAPAGGTAGVFLGGVITEWLDWRWTFLINITAGLLVLAVTSSLVPAGIVAADAWTSSARRR